MNNRFQISFHFPVQQTIHSDLSCRKYETLQNRTRIGKIMQKLSETENINNYLAPFSSGHIVSGN